MPQSQLQPLPHPDIVRPATFTVAHPSPRNVADPSPSSEEHKEQLATKWWMAEEFQSKGTVCLLCTRSHGLNENQAFSVARRHNMSEGDLLFGANRQLGFWAHITHALPQRRVGSVFGYVRRIYQPLKSGGKWSIEDDATLAQVSEALERPKKECLNRFQKCIEHKDTRRKGKWTAEEESRLTEIVKSLGWVARLMDQKRTATQCRNKWYDYMVPAMLNDGKSRRWSVADTFILVHKIASLDLDREEDIEWYSLPDEKWDFWTIHKLQQRWGQLKTSVTSEGATHRRGYSFTLHRPLNTDTIQEIVQRLLEKSPPTS
ncbi:hypothetical protein BGW80DRAFT_1534216 [Lactifluus volemus]|nr:hypothetical protein BGW80DRAFT_1534216 [Lactifluus volemus]